MEKFDVDAYVYSALKNGRSLESVAKEVTEALNNASKAYTAEQEKAKRGAKRLELAQKMIDTLTEYLEFMYPEYDLHELEDVSAEDYADAIDEAMKLTTGVVTTLGSVSRGIESVKRQAKEIKDSLCDTEPLDKFLREHGLK